MTTPKLDYDFRESVIALSLLEESVKWIVKNMAPEDVFPESDLKNWALEMGYTLEGE